MARYYDADIGRFLGVDPLAGQAPGWSSYRYAFDNPVLFVDLNGLFEWHPDSDDPNILIADPRDDFNSLMKYFDDNSIDVNNQQVLKLGTLVFEHAMLNYVKDGKQSLDGMTIDMNGQEIITPMEPNENKRDIDPDPAINEQVSKGGSVELVVHGHPKHREKTDDGHMAQGGFAGPSNGDLSKKEEIEKAHPDAVGVVAGYDLPSEDNPYASGERALNFFTSKDKEMISHNGGLRITWDEYKNLVSKINK